MRVSTFVRRVPGRERLPIDPRIASQRRATRGSPNSRALDSDPPTIGHANIHEDILPNAGGQSKQEDRADCQEAAFPLICMNLGPPETVRLQFVNVLPNGVPSQPVSNQISVRTPTVP